MPGAGRFGSGALWKPALMQSEDADLMASQAFRAVSSPDVSNVARHRLTQVSLAVQSPKAWQSQVGDPGDLKSLVELSPSLRLKVWIYECMAV